MLGAILRSRVRQASNVLRRLSSPSVIGVANNYWGRNTRARTHAWTTLPEFQARTLVPLANFGELGLDGRLCMLGGQIIFHLNIYSDRRAQSYGIASGVRTAPHRLAGHG